jgi:ABC-2 type transport system permease protein
VLRGDRPALLLEADATDPSATGMALNAVQNLASSVASKDLAGALAHLAGSQPPFEVRVHRLYNPENNSQYNTVPGLMGVILTFTMVLMTGLAVTRERERGTMENLLSTPVRPLEVMAGKITPYIAIGLVQASIILGAAAFLFKVPFQGSIVLIYIGALLFVAANLTVGITLSSIARNQLQAMQLTVFYFLPSLLLSGFMFPFRGMPVWAQYVGNILPLTYFNRFIRSVLLKGAGWEDSWVHIWPILLFSCLLMGIAAKLYRKTLD